MFLAGPTLRALCSLIEHLICVSPATSSAGDVFPKVLGQTSSLCFITERSHFTAGVTVWADLSDRGEDSDHDISTVYAWSDSASGTQIVQNLILAFHAMGITV